MQKYNETRQVSFPAELIKEIVLDVEQYPEFIPWCSSAKILSGDTKEQTIKAELEIDFKAIQESYISKIHYFTDDNGCYNIEVQALSGPFSKLDNIWRIAPLPDAKANIEFSIEFAFKSALLNMFSGVFFSLATEKMINAFILRAEKLVSNKKIHKN